MAAIDPFQQAPGIITGSPTQTQIGTIGLPWDKNGSAINSKFFHFIPIDPGRWDALFPYKLLVIDSRNNGVVFGSKKGTHGSDGSGLLTTISFGTSSALIDYVTDPSKGSWLFTLPITPQQLSIQDQFAISTTATLRGVLEEHSGLRFKMINAQGSIGVWPQRRNVVDPPSSPSALQSLFGGTIQAASNLINQVSSVINIADGKHPANKPTSLRPNVDNFDGTSTGYYQALKLQQFLEQYAEAKKDPDNASWRLVFHMPKQNQSFIVTPIAYTWQQNVNKPMEILYNFQLKAWRRVNLNFNPKILPPDVTPLSNDSLQSFLNVITGARRVLSSSLNLIGAVRSDVSLPLNILRITSMFVKESIGVVHSAADLPSQIAKDYASSIRESLNVRSSSISSTNSDVGVRDKIRSVVQSRNQNEGLSSDSVAGGQLGSNSSLSQSLSPDNDIFNNPSANFTLLDQVPLSSLSLNSAQRAVVDQIIEDARNTSVDTFKRYRTDIQELALQLSNSFGTGSTYYNQIYGLPPPTPRLQPITLDEYEILKSLYDVLANYDILTATTQIDDAKKQTNMEYVAGLADTAGIAFTLTNSKILAPVPFGLTIEEISARYLGDPQRWLEIATLNGLRDPYIDEDGFTLLLLSNATGRQITISSDINLYIGQRITVQSATQMPSARTVLEIDRLSDTSFLLTLDGLPDLDNFLIANQAFIQAYLPGTVNSQQKIFIPSDLPVPDDSSITPPASTSNDPLTALSKVDWLLTDKGDLAVNNYGDFRYSSGITNIIQALRIKFGTMVGTVLLHKTFGLGIRVGTISSEIQIQELFNSINDMIQQDPRFSGVSKLQITINGPTLGISCAISLPGQSGVFPVSFALTA